MGRELQKKKNRSSLNKVRRKPKSKKKHFRNPTIAKNWDKSLTLSQNYKRLGLAVGLKQPTGGQEKTVAILNESRANARHDKLAINSTLPTTLSVSEARVERDAKTGRISRIVEDGTALKNANPLHDPLIDIDLDTGNLAEGKKISHSAGQTEVVRELEAIAALGERKKPRHQSTQERKWIESLVVRHGEDYDKMFLDRKLNPMQQTASQLRRKVLEWKRTNGR